jgi:hypothetical protein
MFECKVFEQNFFSRENSFAKVASKVSKVLASLRVIARMVFQKVQLQNE